MRRPPGWAACPVAVVLAAGCGGPVPPAPPPSVSVPPPVTIPPPVTVPPPAQPTQTPTVVVDTAGPASWTTPDLVGSNLQDAQDRIQELTGFEIPITISHDATGAGRCTPSSC